MPTLIDGNYELVVTLGSTQNKEHLNIDPNLIEEITIIQDINKFLPTFRMRLSDPSGGLSYLKPFDSSTNTVSIKIAATGDDISEANNFDFTVYQKVPVQTTIDSAIYDVSGALVVQNFFAPSHIRRSTDTVKQFLGGTLFEELFPSTGGRANISSTLDVTTTLYQPNWTNAELVEDLKKRLRGSNGEAGYKIFVSMLRSYAHLNVRTWNELCMQPISAVFYIGEDPITGGSATINPILFHKNFDSYMLMGATGIKQQNYTYFDYEASEFVTSSVNLDGMTSLTNYHLIDSMDTTESDSAFYGRTHDFTEDFSERAASTLYDKAQGLVKMWADTDGGNMHNLQPGSIVQVMFGLNVGGQPEEYQHSGFWMIEKVIHIIGKTFFTRMLLTRTGLDGSTKECTLVKAQNVRMTPAGVKRL